MTVADAALKDAIRTATRQFKGPLGVAVSGGSDSMALLHAMAEALGADRVMAVTVDHRLREDAQAEARIVANVCKELGVRHDVVTWDGWDGTGNLSDKARKARYELISAWAKAHGLAAVGVAHTADDQAETFLMRLSRRAGLAGLAGMPVEREIAGATIVRPFLTFRREALRGYLADKGAPWVDDPTNDDLKYDRVRMRRALPDLERLGLGTEVLADVSRQLRDARDVIDHALHRFLVENARIDGCDVLLDRQALLDQLPEIRRRGLSHMLAWVSNADYGPRSDAVTRALSELAAERDTALHGCLILSKGRTVRVTREFNALAEVSAEPGSPWDGKWLLSHPEPEPGLAIRALGSHGLLECPNWRETGRPRAALLASPAVWAGDRLIAAPVAGYSNGWMLELSPDTRDFYRSILSR